MKILIVMVSVIAIALSGCNDGGVFPVPSGPKSEREIFTDTNWKITKITIKDGTQDPDQAMPANNVTVIDSGSQIQGTIDFNRNGTLKLLDAESNFLISEPQAITWIMEDNFIQFKRIDDSGNLINSWGYHIQNIFYNKMKWYIPGTRIESDINTVTIIEFESVLLPVDPDTDRE